MSVHATHAFILVAMKRHMPSAMAGRFVPTATSALSIVLGLGLGTSR